MHTSRRRFTALFAAAPLAGQAAVARVQRSLPAGSVTSIGGFAGARLRANASVRLGAFDIDRFVRMVENKTYREWFWHGEQPGKWLEAAILAAAAFRDQSLRTKAEQILKRLVAAQDSDGYLGITDPAVRTARRPIRGMDPYEIYFTLHALITAREVWTNGPALASARRLGDFFLARIGPGKAEFWPLPRPVTIAGHEVHYGLEGTLLVDPMMRLYQATGDKRYLDWCRWAVASIDRWSASDTYSNLDRVAAGSMNLGDIQPNVHAHTLHMNMLGFLRLYQVTGDKRILGKVQGAWRNIRDNYMYVTGGVSVSEGYRAPHALPNSGNVVETCASMSWILLNQHLLELTGNPAHADAIERLLWNHLFAAQTSDGEAFRYHCPLTGWKPAGYYTGPDCCSSSGARILAQLPSLFYTAADNAVYVNQYVPSTVEAGPIRLMVSTTYPAGETIEIGVESDAPFALHLRLPAWCSQPSLSLNDVSVEIPKPGNYAVVRRSWRPGDRVRLTLPMRPHWIEGDHGNRGLIALERGPVVYVLDSVCLDDSTIRRLAGDGKSETMPGLRGVERELAPAQTPEGALGPAFRVNLALADSGRAPAVLLPFANLGHWYRSASEKNTIVSQASAGPDPRRRSLQARILPYSIWLPPA